jgi:uncharacterized membrane protein SpoIIM required for sporulation
MDIDTFIEKYRPEWEWLEEKTRRGSRGLSSLSGGEISEVISRYLRVSSHLAEAQTRFGDQRLETYLSGIVARAHASIYGAKVTSWRAFLRLFGTRYRTAIAATRPYILIMAALMVAVWLATMLWVAGSREARAGILPPFAREAIERATGERRDFGVSAGTVSTSILLNNVRVAFLSFALGITAGVGTAWVVAFNGVLLGALSGAFQAAGKSGIFWSLVLPHGFLELVAICIAAGSGLRMGWAIIDPGDRTRTQALAEEARAAVLVIVGVIPAFIVAAFIEGFLTGTPLLPAAVEIGIGAIVAAGYVWLLFGKGIRGAPTP